MNYKSISTVNYQNQTYPNSSFNSEDLNFWDFHELEISGISVLNRSHSNMLYNGCVTSQWVYSNTAILYNGIVSFLDLSWQYQKPSNNLCDGSLFFLCHPSPNVLFHIGTKADLPKNLDPD